MAKTYLDEVGLATLWGKIKTYVANAAGVTNIAYDSTNTKFTKTINGTTSDIVTLSTLKTAMSLNNVANGAEVNQNAFSNVKVGSRTVAADSKTDTIELVAGSNITLTPDATNDKITITAKDTVTTVTTTGSGNAVTGITASNGALTVAKGSTFLTQHQNAISGVNSNYTEDGVLYKETVDAPLPQSKLNLSSHNNIVATSLSAGSTGSVNVYLDLAVYGTCSTAASTAAKVVSGIKGFALATGSIVAVKFINTNTAAPSTLTLNVNSTGAKSIKYRGAAIPSANRLYADRLYWFVYDGTNYEIIGDLDTTYSSMTQAEATQGTIATARLISPAVLKTTIANAVGDAGGGAQSTITDITSEFTSSNSRIVVRSAIRYGKMVELELFVNRSSTWANGSNGDITATLTSNHLPYAPAETTVMWTGGVLVGTIAGAGGYINSTKTTPGQGHVLLRNLSGSSVSKDTAAYIPFVFRYIYDDGSITPADL